MMIMLVLMAMAVVTALLLWALGQSPLARAIALSMACFAETARGERDALR